MQLRKQSLRKSRLPGFELWPLWYRRRGLTKWRSKPTGILIELDIKLFRSIPGKDEDEVMNTWIS